MLRSTVWANEAIHAARFAWTGAPPGFPFASSLERRPGHRLSMTELMESVTVGGSDVTMFQRSAAGAPVRVAVIGRYGFTGKAPGYPAVPSPATRGAGH